MNSRFIRKIIFVQVIFLQLLFGQLILGQTETLKIVQTTDSHGAIFPFNFITNNSSSSSLSQVNTYLNSLRNNKTQNVLLLSGGDLLQGTPAVYYFNYENTKTKHLYARVMNYMKYDAATIGNHDIETGHDVYDRFVKEVDFPVMAANAINLSTGEPYFVPYKVFRKNSLTIAVLGLITPAIPNWLPEKIYSGIEFDDMIESARKWIPIIKEKVNPDLVIGLFHAGVDYTYGGLNEDSFKNENASLLVAEKVPGFDIVFTGHDHHGWNKWVNNIDGDSVLVIGGTSSAREFSEVEVTSIDGKVKSITSKLKRSKDFAVDTAFISEFKNEFEEVKKYVAKPLGEFSKPMYSENTLFGDNNFSDFINRVQLELTDADISITAPLSLNAVIKKGPVYVRDMFALYKYENLLYTMELTGREIKDVLEYSASKWFNRMKDENDNMLQFVTNAAGELIYSERSNLPMLKERFYNFDSAEGINYTVDITKPAGKRIVILGTADGGEFSENKIYKVAVNSYRGNGGGGHLTAGAGILPEELSERVINSTEKDLRYYIMKWIEEQKTVTPFTTNNWKIIPESYWQKAKQKDFKILFK